MSLLSRFKQYLTDQNLSEASVKNYLADINKFLKSVQGQPLQKADFQNYYQFLIDRETPQATLKRYLSSLRQFGSFLKACGETAANPSANLPDITRVVHNANALDVKKLLDEFAQFLEKERLSPLTIKNYLVDTRQFLAWLAEDQLN